MAPTLVGPHRDVVCADCGYPFACDSEVRPAARRAICPNCGYANDHLTEHPDIAGDRLLVSRAVFAIRSPRRWEVVAFRHPEHPTKIAVKRVVGLPGEMVEIRHGDLYVNGKIQRKPLAQQRAMAVLVYDANDTPRRTPSLPPRWQGDRADSRWDSADGRFVRPASPDQKSVDWLSYRHWCRLPGSPGQAYPCPITNQLGYNQGLPQPSGTICPVTDLLLSFRWITATGQGALHLKLGDGPEAFEVHLEPNQRRYEVSRRNRRLLAGACLPLGIPASGVLVEVSLIDRQFVLALDGAPIASVPLEENGEPLQPSSRPVALGGQTLGVEIRDLRLLQDAYYTRPRGVDARWGVDRPVRLLSGEYFVLGDNSTISLDSRTWPDGPAVPSDLLVGKPFLVFFPPQRVDWGGWHFLVPDLCRIRYIR
jgi:signal peptidase I